MSERIPPPPETLQDRLELMLKAGFVQTDMQFNLGRVEGGQQIGFDLVHPGSESRVFLAEGSSRTSEEVVTRVLGKHSVLGRISPDESRVATYALPEGSRLLVKTLRTAPYKAEYMKSLADRAYRFLDRLAELDTNLFGVDLNRVAITHNGVVDNDDIHFTVLPPLDEPAVPIDNVDEFVAKKRNLLRVNPPLASVKALGRIAQVDGVELLDRYLDGGTGKPQGVAKW